MNQDLKLLSINEIADALGVSRTTIYEYIKLGMPYKQIGPRKKFLLSDVLKWGEENKKVD